MTYEQFFYWLKGFAEISNGAPTEEQWENIKKEMAKYPIVNQNANTFLNRPGQQIPPIVEPLRPVKSPIPDTNKWPGPYPDDRRIFMRDGVGVITAQNSD